MSEAETIGIILGALLSLTGALMVWLGYATKRRKLKRNLIAGIRIPSTLQSDKAWYRGHDAAAFAHTIAGWGTIVVALLPLALHYTGLVPISNEIVTAAMLIACFWLLGWVLWGTWRARGAAQAVLEDNDTVG